MNTIRILKGCGPLLVSVLLCGCFQVKDELTIEADGSGKVRLTVNTSLSDELLAGFGMSRRSGGGVSMYPPVSEPEARHYFPSKDFELKVESKDESAGKTIVIEAGFKDVNRLLASPYARAHQLSLKVEPTGTLAVLGVSAAEQAARAAETGGKDVMPGLEMPGLEEAKKKKGEMRFEFRLTLPNAIEGGNGAREGRTTVWVAERAKCQDDAEFTVKAGGVLEATCPAAGVKFTPVTPPRLALHRFKDLAAGTLASGTPPPDTNKVAASARFVPYALHITRSLDLSGEGASRQSQAQLTGAVLIPRDLAPQRWGKAKLEEAVDAKGNSLMPKDSEDSISFFSGTRFGTDSGDEDEQDAESPRKPKDDSSFRKVVTLTFKAPDWKVKEIAKIKGAIDLQYLGGSEIIKLSNAVPADLVQDLGKGNSPGFSSGSDRGQISNERLAELGLAVEVQMATIQGGMTILSLRTEGKIALMDLQVFDAEGRPWPTTLTHPESDEEEQTCQVMVSGQPKPPFSLAVVAGGVGTCVTVPLLVEKTPTGGQ